MQIEWTCSPRVVATLAANLIAIAGPALDFGQSDAWLVEEGCRGFVAEGNLLGPCSTDPRLGRGAPAPRSVVLRRDGLGARTHVLGAWLHLRRDAGGPLPLVSHGPGLGACRSAPAEGLGSTSPTACAHKGLAVPAPLAAAPTRTPREQHVRHGPLICDSRGDLPACPLAPREDSRPPPQSGLRTQPACKNRPARRSASPSSPAREFAYDAPGTISQSLGRGFGHVRA